MSFVNRHGWWSTQIDGVSIFDEEVEEGQIFEGTGTTYQRGDKINQFHEDISSTVKNMVDAVGLFEYGCNLSGALAEDEKEEKDLSQRKVYLKMLEVGSTFTNGCLDIQCERCLAPRGIVRSRGISWYSGTPWCPSLGLHDSPSNFIDDLEIQDLGDPEGCAELVCRSCTFSELEENEETYELVETDNEWCMCCNLCDGLSRRDGSSLRGTFIHTPGEEADEIRCYECHSSHLEEFCMAVRGTEVCYDYEEPYVMCSECGIECISLTSCEHVAAANPPLMIYNGEDSENIRDIICDECGGFSSWDCICPRRHSTIQEVDDTFEGEFENVELPENNSEKASEIKDVVKELGEEMYDLQETLTEGQYLKMMNLLQKITNKVNAL